MTLPPRFTILICNYNYGRFVGEAVQSCLEQTYPADAYDIVVVDDGSTDDSLAVLQAFSCDPRVTVVSQVNAGQASAFATGIERATGDYVCLLDSDDVYEPEKLERVAAKLAAYPTVPDDFFLCHDLHLVEQFSGEPTRKLPLTWFQTRQAIQSYSDCLTVSQAGLPFPFAVPCGAVFSRGLLHKILRAIPRSEFRISADTPILWASLLAAGAVHYLHEPLARYRAHGENGYVASFSAGITSKFHPREHWPRNLAFLETFLDTLDLSETERNDRLAVLRRLQREVRVSSARPRLPEPRLSVLVAGTASSAGWARTLRSIAGQSHQNLEIVVPRDNPLSREGVLSSVVPDLTVTECEGTGPLELAANAYRAARGEYFTLAAAGDTLDRTFAERHLHVHRHGALCMVTSSDFRLAGARGELIHEACLASTGSCRSRIMTRSFDRPVEQWSFSPRSANVFRRWPAIDVFFSHLPQAARVSNDGNGEWLLLYFAQALGGSFRWPECLSTLSLLADDRPFDIARGLPAFGASPALSADRVRLFLYGLLCACQVQLMPLLGVSGARAFVAWLRAGASPQVLGLMRGQAVAAGADPQIVAMLVEDK